MNMNLTLTNIMMSTAGRMKILIISGAISLLFGNAFAQNAQKGAFTFELGTGLNGYKLESSQSFDSSPAGSLDFNGMIGYNFHDKVNANLEYENHTYFRDVTNQTEYLGAHRLGIGLRYAVIDVPSYQLSVGATVGGFNFGYVVKDTASNDVELGAKGIYQTYGITNKFFFGGKKAFGVFLKAGIINNPMTIDKIVVNGENKEELDGVAKSDYKINSIGYYAKFGLMINLVPKQKKN